MKKLLLLFLVSCSDKDALKPEMYRVAKAATRTGLYKYAEGATTCYVYVDNGNRAGLSCVNRTAYFTPCDSTK